MCPQTDRQTGRQTDRQTHTNSEHNIPNYHAGDNKCGLSLMPFNIGERRLPAQTVSRVYRLRFAALSACLV